MVLPFLLVITMIKNSGILFVVFLVIYTLLVDDIDKQTKAKITVCFMLPALISFLFWQAHIKMVYVNANASRHSMSLNYMRHVFEERSIEQDRCILGNFMKIWFLFDRSYEWQIIMLF